MKILCHSKHGSDDIFTDRDRKGKFSLTGVCPRVGLASQRALQVTRSAWGGRGLADPVPHQNEKGRQYALYWHASSLHLSIHRLVSTHPPLDKDTLPPGQRPAQVLTSSSGHCSGWHASYWNAFLCTWIFTLKVREFVLSSTTWLLPPNKSR